ncbi:SDR family oxidoreductase [Halobacteriaceae archaeon GCM10025711]
MTRPEVGAGVADVDLGGRTVLVTGATSGVGRETALALGRLGARVLVHGRDRDRGRETVAALRDDGVPDPVFLAADFADLDAVRGLAARVREETDGLDVLVNNAGAHFQAGTLTDAGVERTFAVNHLAPFLLTNLLIPAVPADGRIVTVSSALHSDATLDLDAVRSVDGYDGLAAYSRSKLANVLFTMELARRLDDRTATVLHPGFVPGSSIWRDARLHVRLLMAVLDAVPQALTGGRVSTPAQAAETSVYLAASPAVADVTGAYFADCERKQPGRAARDETAQQELWAFSEDVAGLAETETPSP